MGFGCISEWCQRRPPKQWLLKSLRYLRGEKNLKKREKKKKKKTQIIAKRLKCPEILMKDEINALRIVYSFEIDHMSGSSYLPSRRPNTPGVKT